MKRTQLYLDEEMSRLLAAESRQRGTTVSSLVRDAIATRYGTRAAPDRRAIIDRLAGVWKDRNNVDAERWLRGLRVSRRSERWGGGGDVAVPARQRRRDRVAAGKRRRRRLGAGA
ncbi:MAG TPA: CopG family transcriptional regulator [Candidatus Binatia bacterium]|nr:CopG family transcriptional regulator [Candidatus Binatia bacterium]